MAEFKPIECTHEGTTMRGTIASLQTAGPHAAVIMIPGASGTSPTFERQAGALANLGYLVVCADLYDKQADLSTPQAMGKEFMGLMDAPDELRGRSLTWLDMVAGLPEADAGRIAALGYCFGGKSVLEIARSGADLKAVVSFHGLLTTHKPAPPGSIIPEVVAWCAGQDPYAPLTHVEEFRQEMRAAGASHQITIFSYAQHSFTNPDHEGMQEGIAYHPMADRISWAGTLALLDHLLR